MVGKKFLFSLCCLFIGCNAIPANASLAEIKSDSALIVIDVQKAFSDSDGFSPVCREQADNMLPVINALIEKFSQLDREIIYIKQEYVRDAEFDRRLKISGDVTFTKKAPSSFSNQDFENHLRKKSIKNLYIVGLAAEYCVSATISEALNKGFRVVVVGDALAAKVCTSLQDEVDSYKAKGAKVLLSKDI